MTAAKPSRGLLRFRHPRVSGRKSMNRKLVAALVALAFFTALAALAGDTRRFDLDSFDRFSKGSAVGIEIKSSGKLQPIAGTESFGLSEDSIWSLAPGKGGEVYLGTGNGGRLYRFEAGQIKEVARTDKLIITRVRLDSAGAVWFIAIPDAALYRLEGGQAKKVADLGETYAWDFIFSGDEILVATGPRGRILRLSRSGERRGVIETGEQHVMCLLAAGDGKTYAGTAGDGLLLELTGKDGFRVVNDFDEKEIKALAWVEEDKALIVAANQDAGAPGPGPSAAPAVTVREPPKAPGAGEQPKEEEQPAAPVINLQLAPAAHGRGRANGAVYALLPGRAVRKLVDLPKRAAVDLAVAGRDIYAATDQEGKVYKCRADRSDYAIAFDLVPSQILALAADKHGLTWIGAGSPAALFKVKTAGLAVASYTSEVLDARFPARFGAIDYTADGPVRILTRSGAVADPARGWSQWAEAGPGRPAAVHSPDARYLQLKVEWLPGMNTTLRALTVPYLAYNQSHFIDSIQIEGLEQDREKSGEEGRIKSPDGVRGPAPHQTVRKFSWKVTNPDNDPLLFELYYQPDASDEWIRIPGDDPVTKTKFDWQTESIPDGWYRLKIVATDLPANPPAGAIAAEAFSERFLIDNGRPEIKGLTVAGRKVTGRALDSFSAISGIQYTVDGDDWTVVAAADGVLDTPDEDFSFELPPTLAPGPHLLTVRAWDRAGNIGSGSAKCSR